MSSKEPELLLQGFGAKGSDKRLEIALEKALKWQAAVEDSQLTVNDHTYYGPHKWIVCLLGSENYSVGAFLTQFEE